MENRDRDKLSRNSSKPTDAGNVNKETSNRKGNLNDDSTADFGQTIGRSETVEEPNRRGNNDEMKSDFGRSSGSESTSSPDGESGSRVDRNRSESEH